MATLGLISTDWRPADSTYLTPKSPDKDFTWEETNNDLCHQTEAKPLH